jgi:DNA-binding CsgD family transcriptional regulator
MRKLTLREAQVASLVARGLSNQKAASSLNIGEQTVKNHLNNVFRKLGVRNRTQMMLLITRSGLLSLRQPPEGKRSSADITHHHHESTGNSHASAHLALDSHSRDT